MSGRPSPSMSATAIPRGDVPGEVVKSTLGANEPASIVCNPLKVTMNGAGEYAVSIFALEVSVTVIGANAAPVGTRTCRVLLVAEMTSALTVPKHTMLFAAVELKPLPVIVMTSPTGPERGENESIVGVCALSVAA